MQAAGLALLLRVAVLAGSVPLAELVGRRGPAPGHSSAILLHPPLPSVRVSIGMDGEGVSVE